MAREEHEEDIDIVPENEDIAIEKQGDIAKVKAQLKDCKKERQEYLDGWQRAKADFINTKKRLEEKVTRAHRTGIDTCIESFLPTLDSLYTALSDERIEGGAREGLELIRKQFLSALKAHSVEEINPVGEPFNPTLHEPLSTVAVADETQDDIVQEIYQRGYMHKGTVLRPAKVVVGTFSK